MAASSVGNIHVNLLVNTGGTRAFTSAANVIGRDSDRLRRALGGTNTSVHALRASMSQGIRSRIFSDIIRQASQSNNEVAKLRATMMGLAAITGTSLTGAFAGTFLLQTADQANRLNNQLRTVTSGEENLIGVRERLYAISQLSRSDMAATVTLYSRLSRAAQEFGASQAEVVRVTETIQKAFAIGGASQAEASGAAIQLSQGIASDRFSGEEYRSVSENAPVLLQQMARHLGVTIGKLREMAHAGELTGKVVTEAILGASSAIDDDFNKTITTAGQSLTKVGNAFLMYIGETDSALGVTQRLSTALSSLAENFDEIAAVAAPLAGVGLALFGGNMAGRAVGGAFAQLAKGAREARKETLEGAAATTFAAKTEELRARAVAKSTVADVAATQARVASGQADAAALRQTLALTQAQRAKAVATTELNRGIAEATGRVGPYNAALVAQNASTKAVLSTQRVLRQVEGELAANKSLLVAQTSAATTAAAAHNAALATTAVRARAAAVSMSAMRVAAVAAQRVGSGLLSLMGGPLGLAFTAAIVGMTMYATNAAKAEERTRKLTEEMRSLGLISDKVAGVTEDTAESIEQLSQAAARVKLADIQAELDRMRSGQNIFDQIFAYDPQMLGNVLQQLERVQNGFTPDGRGVNTLSPEDMTSVDRLRGIAEAARDGAAPVEVLLQQLSALTENSPDAPRWLLEMVAALEIAVPKMEGLKTYAEQTAAAIDKLNASGVSTGWIENLVAQEESLAAVQAGADAISALADEQIRVLGLSEEEARLEEIKAALRKDSADAVEDGAVIQEAVLNLKAREILAEEILADKRKEALEAQEDFSKKVAELSTEIDDATSSFEDMQAAATIKRLLEDFATGNMKADTLKDRLAQINSVNLSDPMDTLIAKIIAAIGPLAQLLGIFNSFGGASPLGGDLPGPSRPGGALGRSRRELQAKQEIGQGVLDSAVSDAGMSERDSWIADKTDDLKSQAEALGGVATNAASTATTLWEMDQAQQAAEKSGNGAADAAEKYAEGMAELHRELAAAPLDPFLKEVLSAAEGMGIATDELDAFVAAVSSGGIDAAPSKFREIAAAMQEIKAINIMQDLQFEGQQMFRSDTEQNVYQTLRDAGIDVASAQGEMIAGQIRFNDALGQARDIAAGFASDFRGALMEGQSFWEALGNAGANALDKIAAKAMDMAVNGIFEMIFGAVMGGITGSGGGFSSSITGSGGGFFPGLTGPSLMSFAGGGGTGNGLRAGGLDGIGGFLAMLHPKETVIDHTVASAGSAASGISDAANAPGINIYNTMEVMPGATEEDGAAFARGVSKELRRQLPDAIKNYERNPLRRPTR